MSTEIVFKDVMDVLGRMRLVLVRGLCYSWIKEIHLGIELFYVFHGLLQIVLVLWLYILGLVIVTSFLIGAGFILWQSI